MPWAMSLIFRGRCCLPFIVLFMVCTWNAHTRLIVYFLLLLLLLYFVLLALVTGKRVKSQGLKEFQRPILIDFYLFTSLQLAPNKQNKCKCAPQRHITPKVINNCLPEEEIQLNQLSTGLRVTTLRGHDSLLAKTTTQRSRHNVGSMRNAGK